MTGAEVELPLVGIEGYLYRAGRLPPSLLPCFPASCLLHFNSSAVSPPQAENFSVY